MEDREGGTCYKIGQPRSSRHRCVVVCFCVRRGGVVDCSGSGECVCGLGGEEEWETETGLMGRENWVKSRSPSDDWWHK